MTKRTKNIVLILVFSAIFIGLIISLNKQSAQKTCTEVIINIDSNYHYSFLSRDSLFADINAAGIKLIGCNTKDIDLDLLEKTIEENIYVRNADVYSNLKGKLTIDILQRRPMLRIINSFGETYFLDEYGRIMPLKPSHASRVIIANGYITESKKDIEKFNCDLELLEDTVKQQNQHYKLFHIVKQIEKDSLFSAQITQIYINKDGAFELVPLLGDHIILIDNPLENLELKLENLRIFYTEGLNNVGWDRYDIVNISYDNQVVCTKKDSIK
jgi:cell division protein FtsQ